MLFKRGLPLAAAGLAALLALPTMPAAAKEEVARHDAGSFAGAYLAARAAEADNDLDSAIGYYRDALTYEPTNRTIQQNLLLTLIARGSFDDALAYAEKLKEVPEAERFARLALAIQAFREEDHARAETLLKLVMESDLDRLITGIMTAWAKLGEGDPEGALAHLDELSGPDWYKVFIGHHKGLIAMQAGMDERVREYFDAVLADMPSGGSAPDTYLRAAEAYARYLHESGDREEALAALDKADEFVAGRLQIESLRADVEAGRPATPLVGSVRHGAGEVLLNVASALNRGGGEAFVRLYLQYALALRPDSDAALIQLGAVAEQQNEPDRAIEYYSRIPESSPMKRPAELQLGLNLADLDRREQAIEHLSDLLDDDPTDIRAYLALGGVYSAEKEYDKAAEVYDRAVAVIDEPSREHWNVYYQRGIAYERLKRWPEAEPNFRKALELYPDHPQVLNYLGYSWVDMNMNLEEGLEMIARAVEQRPSDGYIVDSLGWAYYRLGRYEDAVRELERAVSLMPDDPVLNDHLGDAYWRVGRRLEATFQWSHARDLDPEPALMEEVVRKLMHGLAEPENPAAAERPADPPAPKTEVVPSTAEDQRG